MNVLLEFFPPLAQAPIAYLFCLLTIIVSIWAFKDKKVYFALLFHPYEVFRQKRWYTIFTSALIHKSVKHVLLNCIFIVLFFYDITNILTYSFKPIEVHLLCLTLVLLLISIPHVFLIFTEKSNFMFTCVGSSGVTYGLISFSLAYFPLNPITTYIPFIQYSFHVWITFLLIIIGSSFIFPNNNNKLHFFAYGLGAILALCLSPALF